MTHSHAVLAKPAVVLPISAALLTGGADPTDRTGSDQGYKTSSVPLLAGKTYIGFIMSFRVTDLPQGSLSCTMPGTTWALIGQSADERRRMAAFRCQPAADVAAAQITVGNFDPVGFSFAMWQFLEITGAVADTGNNGAAAIGAFAAARGNGTSPSVDVGTVEAANGCVAGVYTDNSSVALVGTGGFAIVNEASSMAPTRMASLWAQGLDTPAALGVGVAEWCIAGVEVIAA